MSEPYLINPPRRRRRRGHKRGCRCVVCGHRRHSSGRRRYRRNPAPAAAIYANPARRRRRRSKRRSTRRRSSGMFGGIGIMRDLQASLPAVGWGMVGYTGTTFLPTILARFIALPDKTTNPMGYWATKVAAAAGTSFVVRQFAGRKQGSYAFRGALITMGAEVVNDFIFPMMGLATYIDPDAGVGMPVDPDGSMGYLNPGRVVGDYEAPVGRLNPDMRL